MSLRISTAIAVWNGAGFLTEQLDSILAQSRVPDEIVVCDDGSDDGSWEILEEYRRQWPEKFKIYRNQTNYGCAGNFAGALSLCSGEIIFLADQDDVWLPGKVERMLKKFSSPAVLGVYSDSLIVDEKLHPCGTLTHLKLRGFDPQKLPFMPQLATFCRRVPPAAHDMAIRKEALEFLLPFPELSNVHDSFIGTVIAALDGWEVVPEALTLFRQHGNNASGSGKKLNWAGQLQAAKKSIASNTFLWNAQLYQAVTVRLQNRISPRALAMLAERERHSANRAKMNNCGLLKRFELIARELFTGRYFRFARGLKSIVQDLFLR